MVESLGLLTTVTMTAVGDFVSLTAPHPASAGLRLGSNEGDGQCSVIGAEACADSAFMLQRVQQPRPISLARSDELVKDREPEASAAIDRPPALLRSSALAPRCLPNGTVGLAGRSTFSMRSEAPALRAPLLAHPLTPKVQAPLPSHGMRSWQPVAIIAGGQRWHGAKQFLVDRDPVLYVVRIYAVGRFAG